MFIMLLMWNVEHQTSNVSANQVANASDFSQQSSLIIAEQTDFAIPDRPSYLTGNLSVFKDFVPFNPSMALHEGKMYWYQRFSSFAKSVPWRQGKKAFISTITLCSSMIGFSVSSSLCTANDSYIHFEAPPWRIFCDWKMGPEDLRLFSFNGSLWGLGARFNPTCKRQSPILINLLSTPVQYIPLTGPSSVMSKMQKNWIAVPSCSNGSVMDVVLNREPLEVAHLDFATGSVNGFAAFPESTFFHPYKPRGSTQHIPWDDETALTTVHIKDETFVYLNIFVLVGKCWPYRTLARSEPFFMLKDGLSFDLSQRGAVNAVQFLSGLTYVDASRERIMLSYGDADHSSKVLQFRTDDVRFLFRMKEVVV